MSCYISEKLVVSKDSKQTRHSCQPNDRDELRKILKDRLSKDKDADLNDIDVSLIENMSYLFALLDPHKIDISQWDVSNVENIEGMFFDCRGFNADLSSWDVSNVVKMYSTFENC